MPADYQILADVYDTLGMGEFARTMTPRLLDFAQRGGWLGRQIIDLGCGTGVGLHWLAKHSYITTGVDNSPEMLRLAKANFLADQLPGTWLEQDMRELNRPSSADMVMALNVFNEFNNIQELQTIFEKVHATLKAGKWFIFDVYTVEGLFSLAQADRIEVNTDELTILTQNQFDHDLRVQTRNFLIFRSTENGWQRQNATRTLWASPVPAVRGLLQRAGFNVLHLLTTDFNRYEPGKPGTNRVIIMAQKR
jgi:SAM-dependent methyltransferase